MSITRRKFIKNACLAALGLSFLGSLGCMYYKINSQSLKETIIKNLPNSLALNKNIGYLCLDVEKAYFDFPDSCYGLLEDLVKAAKKKINPNKQNEEEILRIIETILTDDFKYEYRRTNHFFQSLLWHNRSIIDEDNLGWKIIKRRENDCDTGSYIYLAIGEALGLPLRVVNVPYHTFIRWYSDKKKIIHLKGGVVVRKEDNIEYPIWICGRLLKAYSDSNIKDYINWDRRYIRSDEDYKEWLHISERSIENGVYLRGLTRKETLANIYTMIGHALRSSEKKHDVGITCYNKALELNPTNTWAFQGKAAILINLKRYKESLKVLELALNLDNLDYFALIRKGEALTGLEEYDKAIEYFERAEEYFYYHPIMEKAKAKAFINKGKVLIKLKKYNKAIECFNSAIEYYNQAKTIYRSFPFMIEREFYGGAFYYKGFILDKKGKRTEAKKYNEKAKNMGFEETETWITL